MNDTELGMAVVRVISPEYEWITDDAAPPFPKRYTGAGRGVFFDYTSDDALGKMCVWLAKNRKRMEEAHLSGRTNPENVLNYLASDNPHKAIAVAIIRVASSD